MLGCIGRDHCLPDHVAACRSEPEMMDQQPVEAHVLGTEPSRQLVRDLVERALIADQAEEAALSSGGLKAALELCRIEQFGIVIRGDSAERRRASREACC